MAGELLKKRREELGIDIREIAGILRISHEYLSALENDSFEKLPVAVYTVGYIRSYANYLGIDAGPVIQNFTSHLTSPKPSTIIPVASSRRGISRSLFAMLAILSGVLLFSVFLYWSASMTDIVPDEQISPSVQERTLPAAAPVAPDRMEAGMPAEKHIREGTLQESFPIVAEKTEHELVVTARDAVWLQCKFSDGKVEEMLLSSGVSKNWDFNGTVLLKIGNAGGVSLRFDGKDLGTPGKPGQVVSMMFPPGSCSFRFLRCPEGSLTSPLTTGYNTECRHQTHRTRGSSRATGSVWIVFWIFPEAKSRHTYMTFQSAVWGS